MNITNCKLSKKSQLRLLESFELELTARSAANILEINANSSALYYQEIRQLIHHYLALESKQIFEGVIELDESYFGGVRKGKRGRGVAGKVAVFRIYKRGGKVYTQAV